jgi:ATP adenylyltransferase
MERLFRQRMEYLTSQDSEGCFLCHSASSPEDEANLVLDRNESCMAVLNRYPYNTGHVMVAPLRHVGEIEDLTRNELAEVMDLSISAIAALRAAFNSEGFNIGANLGSAAGAGLPGHFHMHVVPRWEGDTNFMPVVADSKVLPETLEETYRRLRPLFSASAGS